MNNFKFSVKTFSGCFCLVLFNLITIGTPINLIITIPQALYIIFLLLHKKTAKALLYHILFVVTCISATSSAGMSDELRTIYSYSRVKLVDPVGLSYILSILILLLSLKNTIKIKNTLFYKLIKTFFTLGLTGFVMGLWGFLMDDNYAISGVLNYGIYILVLSINGYALILNYTTNLTKQFYELSIHVICAGIIATFVAYSFLGISTTYGGLNNIILQPDLIYYAASLLLGLYVFKNDYRILIPLFMYIIISLNTSGGKTIAIFAFVLIYFIYTIYFSKYYKNTYSSYIKQYRVLSIIIIAFVILNGIGITFNNNNLFSQKLQQFLSLFSGNISDIDTSLYIRVVSFWDIVCSFGYNPIRWLFGMGYGGYFIDVTGLLGQLNLGEGAFSMEDIKTGYFHTAHDTFCSVPLINGFFGLYLLIRIVIKYIYRIKYNFLATAAIPWLLLTFYFNTQLALVGMMMLFGSEYINIDNKEKDECTSNR